MKISKIIFGKNKSSEKTKKLRLEMKKTIVGFLIAAFGFLAALVWRDVINEFINKIVVKLNIPESAPYYHLVVAVIVTIVCAFGVVIISKFNVEDNIR